MTKKKEKVKTQKDVDARCQQCFDDNPAFTDWISCDDCNKWYHVECQNDSISVEMLKAIDHLRKLQNKLSNTDGIRVLFTCNMCRNKKKSEKREIDELKIVVNDMKENMIEIMNVISSLNDKLEDENDPYMKVKKSYAQVTTTSVPNVIPVTAPVASNYVKNYPRLHLKVKGEPKEAQKKFYNVFQKANKKMKINKLFSTNEGDLKIECLTKEDSNQLKEIIEKDLNANFTIKENSELKPKIKVVGLKKHIPFSNDELEEDLIMRNDLACGIEDVRLVKRIANEKYKDESIIFEVNPKVFSKLMKRQYVFLGTQRLNVSEHIHIRRCGNCLEYNHGTKDCKQKGKSCGKCGKGSHVSSSCGEEIERCQNCVKRNESLKNKMKNDFDEEMKFDVQHSIYSKECPVYCELVKSVKRRTNYE